MLNSESFFRNVLEHLNGDIAIFDREHRYVYVNPYAVKDALIREWLVGKTDFDYCEYRGLDIEIAINRRRRFEEALEKKSIVEWEEKFVGRDGNIRYFIRKISPVFDVRSGELLYMTGHGLDITDRRKVEMQLDEAQLLTSSGSWVWNLSDNSLEWSIGMYQIFNLNAENYTPDLGAMLRLSTVESADIFRSALDKVKTTQVDVEFVHWVMVGGETKVLKARLRPQFNVRNELISVFASEMDITESTRIESQLLLNEQNLNEAQELAKMGSFEYYPLTGRITWSKGLYSIWEFDESVKPDMELFFGSLHQEDKEKVIAESLKSRVLNEYWEIEYRISTPSGKLKYVRTHTKVLGGVARDEQVFVGSCIDITETRNFEIELRYKEQSLLLSQDIAKLGTWYLDLEKNEIQWTSGVYKMWERDFSLPSPTVEEFAASVHAEDWAALDQSIDEINNTGEDRNIEFRILFPDGRIKHIEGRGRLQENCSPGSGKLFGTLMDITERKMVEAELVRSKTLAEESSKAKEYFLANISHELRTPLNGILGMSRLLRKTNLSTNQREYTDVLHQTAENLLVIINDMLDFAKIDAGKVTFEEVDFNPVRVADTAVQLQMFKAEQKDLTLRHFHKGENSIPILNGDPYRLSQILLNLLNNAIKYTDRGEVVLSHEVVESTIDSVKLRFNVEDTGIGIPEELQQKIFESFTQVSNGFNRKAGMGLGLTITKNLIESQGGTIHVKSTPDVGSIFTFEISYKKAKPLNVQIPVAELDYHQLGSLKILLAEDNKVNLFITEAILRDWGFQVDVACDGKEAIELLSVNKYDLVLMDIQMPVMDGVEATRSIRELKDPSKSGIPIIALTANTGRQAHRQFILLGMNDWLVKPFKEETLYKKIAMHIRGKNWLSDTMRKRKFPVRKRPAALSEQQLYNLDLLRRDLDNDARFLSRMLKLFLDTIPAAVESMYARYDAGAFDDVADLAHKIKPTIDGVGIRALKDTLRNIENYRERKRNATQLKSDLEFLRRIIDEVCIRFNQELDNIKSDSTHKTV